MSLDPIPVTAPQTVVMIEWDLVIVDDTNIAAITSWLRLDAPPTRDDGTPLQNGDRVLRLASEKSRDDQQPPQPPDGFPPLSEPFVPTPAVYRVEIPT